LAPGGVSINDGYTMMDQDPLSQLRDIHLPDPGGFWPPAPGWWILAAAALVLVCLAVWLLMRNRRRNRWLRLARAELQGLEQRASQDPAWFSELNGLLKRCARIRYPERRPEALSGDDWIEFLLETGPAENRTARPALEAMVSCCWRPDAHCDPGEAARLGRAWLGRQQC